jgi:alpha-tubulin suppressor-like RCC1 family protein
MALGGVATCVLRDSGGVDCAGSDASGLLGDGEPADGVRAELAPIDVSEPAQWLGVGASHACAVLYGGEVWCWGAADRGQTGAAGATAAPALAIAAPEDESETIDELVLGAHHACMRRASGVIECWCSDAAGQLGDAMVHPACAAGGACSAAAVVVEALSDTFDLAAGRDATCAVRESGAVACWGRADTGLLGASPAGAAACTVDDGATATCVATPLDVPGVERAITIAVGDQHACAVDEDGVVWCWGGSASGQAGAEGATVGMTEVELPIASVAIVAGRAHTCALAIDETVWCWGANDLVQRGQGDEPGDATPTRVPGLPPAIDLASGADHLCALTSDAEIWCWGRNTEAQLADGEAASGGEGPPRRVTRS